MKNNFIADRITELRMQKGISEYKMNRDLGQSKSYIGMIVSGKANPSIAGLLAICDYFNISPVEFFDSELKEDTVNLVKAINKLPDEKQKAIFEVVTAFVDQQSLHYQSK